MKCVATRCCLTFALATALAACASVPASPPPDLKDQARSLQSRRLDDAGLRVAETRFDLPAAVDSPWTPDRVTVAAWYFDPTLAQARAAAMRQAADATLAAQRANPTLQLSPEKVFSGLSAGSPWTVGMALLLPLLHPGESAARRDMAAARLAMASDHLALAVWRSRVRATGALRRLLLARQAEALASRIAASQAAYRDGVRQRVAKAPAIAVRNSLPNWKPSKRPLRCRPELRNASPPSTPWPVLSACHGRPCAGWISAGRNLMRHHRPPCCPGRCWRAKRPGTGSI